MDCLRAEYERLAVIIQIFDKLTPNEYKPDFSSVKKGEIGRIMIKEICLGFLVLSIANLILIVAILFQFLPTPI